MEQQNDSPTELRQDDSSQSDFDVAEVGYDDEFRRLPYRRHSDAFCEIYHVALMLRQEIQEMSTTAWPPGAF